MVGGGKKKRGGNNGWMRFKDESVLVNSPTVVDLFSITMIPAILILFLGSTYEVKAKWVTASQLDNGASSSIVAWAGIYPW